MGIMKARTRLLRLENLDKLTSITNLAYVQKLQGRSEDAEGLMGQAERLERSRTGP